MPIPSALNFLSTRGTDFYARVRAPLGRMALRVMVLGTPPLFRCAQRLSERAA